MAPVETYLDTLLMELDTLCAHMPHGVRLARLHWGGGTPTLLPAAAIKRLSDGIAAKFPFADAYEFSAEIDPNEIDLDRVDALWTAGLTRASLGVQDFNPEIQGIIGRHQSFEVTARAVSLLRDAGVKSLNTDILYGLPNQTPEKITNTVQQVLSLEPDRIALYGYAHVPWMARRQSLIPTDLLPTPQERLALFETARQLFLWEGHDEIGIDHFALPNDPLSIAKSEGRLRRNFQGYTDDQSIVLLGLGASAISRFPQGYAQNEVPTAKYTDHVRHERLPAARGYAFCGDDTLRGLLIEMILCQFAIYFDRIPFENRALGIAICKDVFAQFKDVMTISDNCLSLRPEARPLARIIARSFDAHTMEQKGHSLAV